MSKIRGYFSPREMEEVKTFDASNSNHMRMLDAIGVNENVYNTGMDAEAPYISGGVSARQPLFTKYLPGVVSDLTTVRKIDTLVGQLTVGSYLDQDVMQMIQERTGEAKSYSEGTQIPYTSYATTYERRDLVRFVIGTKSDMLSDGRMEATGVNPEQVKMSAAVTGLEIARNQVGFNGFTDGGNKTYGLLNDPNLPAYQTLPNGASTKSEWVNKTLLEKQKDFNIAVSSLRTTTGGNFDPTLDNFTIALALSVAGTLTDTNEFGISMMSWINQTYPKCRIEFVPEFDSANGGANVFYMYVENMKLNSSDNGSVIDSIITEKFMSIGKAQEIGGHKEGFINVVGGVFVKRPYGIYRATGV